MALAVAGSWIFRSTQMGEAILHAIARGTAAAALTLQSVILQALVYRGTMTPAEALEVVDKALTASLARAKGREERDDALVTVAVLEGVREAIAEMNN
jgi:hypothetical protein